MRLTINKIHLAINKMHLTISVHLAIKILWQLIKYI